MLRERSIQLALERRRQRRALIIFAAAGATAVAAFHDRQITVDPTSRRVVGEEVQVTT